MTFAVKQKVIILRVRFGRQALYRVTWFRKAVKVRGFGFSFIGVLLLGSVVSGFCTEVALSPAPPGGGQSARTSRTSDRGSDPKPVEVSEPSPMVAVNNFEIVAGECLITENMEMTFIILYSSYSLKRPMKVHELLKLPESWCQDSPARDRQGHKLQTFDRRAVKWCTLSAVQVAYPPSQWEEAMDRLLLALSVSSRGLNQMTKSDKACCLMEWNDDHRSSFQEVREVMLSADV
jgi:hypothetical protein